VVRIFAKVTRVGLRGAGKKKAARVWAAFDVSNGVPYAQKE